MLKNVVLPAPLGPMIETIRPRGIRNDTSSTATRPPKTFVIPVVARIASSVPDGRATGVLDVSLRQAPQALATLGRTGTIPQDRAQAAAAVAEARETGDLARATLNFEAGQTTLGPVAIAPAPKVYEPR